MNKLVCDTYSQNIGKVFVFLIYVGYKAIKRVNRNKSELNVNSNDNHNKL